MKRNRLIFCTSLFLVAIIMLMKFSIAVKATETTAQDTSDEDVLVTSEDTATSKKEEYNVTENKADPFKYILIPEFCDEWYEWAPRESVTTTKGKKGEVSETALKSYYLLQEYMEKEYGVTFLIKGTYRKSQRFDEIKVNFPGSDPYTLEDNPYLYLEISIRDGDVIIEDEVVIAEKLRNCPVQSILADYGFILRYPPPKLCVLNQPYSLSLIRYVGSSELAYKIVECGSFEEYFSRNK